MATSMKLSVNGVTFETTFDVLDTHSMVDINNELVAFSTNIKTALAVLASQGIQATTQQPAAQQAAQPANGNAAQQVETWTSTHIRHDFQNGRHQFRLIGGRWTQFGAPIYEDSCQIADPNVKTQVFGAPMGDSPFTHVAVISLRDGKPYRVESIS